jgi:hypothetical protein
MALLYDPCNVIHCRIPQLVLPLTLRIGGVAWRPSVMSYLGLVVLEGSQSPPLTLGRPLGPPYSGRR